MSAPPDLDLTPEQLVDRCKHAMWVGWEMVAGKQVNPPQAPSDAVRSRSQELEAATEVYMAEIQRLCPNGSYRNLALTHAENALTCGVSAITEKPPKVNPTDEPAPVEPAPAE